MQRVCVCVYVHAPPTHTYTRADTCSPHKSQVVTRFISTNMIHARPVLRAFGLAGEDHLVTLISTCAALRAVLKASLSAQVAVSRRRLASKDFAFPAQSQETLHLAERAEQSARGCFRLRRRSTPCMRIPIQTVFCCHGVAEDSCRALDMLRRTLSRVCTHRSNGTLPGPASPCCTRACLGALKVYNMAY